MFFWDYKKLISLYWQWLTGDDSSCFRHRYTDFRHINLDIPNLILSKIKSIKNVIQFLELIKIRIRNTNIMTKKMKNKCNARFIWTPWSKFGVIYALFFFCCNANLASDLYFFFLYHFLVFSVSTEIKRTCAYLGVRNVSFSGNFAYVLNGWTPFEWCVEF